MNTYRFRFHENNVPRVQDISAPGPVQALDKFHRFMQTESGILPNNYRLDSMDQFYNGDAVRIKMVESKIDLPATTNPDLGKNNTQNHESQSELAIELK